VGSLQVRAASRPGWSRRTTLPARLSSSASHDAAHEREAVGLDDAGSVRRLRQGFVGRRRIRAALLRRWKYGDRVLVVCGLGGLGKTAACTDAVPRLARRMGGPPVRVLALDGRAAAERSKNHSPIQALWEQVQAARDDAAWSQALADLQKEGVTGAALAAAIAALAEMEGGLLLYLDDAESLQKPLEKVAAQDSAHIGQWRNADLGVWWRTLIEMAKPVGRFAVVASSRYTPDYTPEEAVEHLEPMVSPPARRGTTFTGNTGARAPVVKVAA
jgi:hypothetical protein